MAVKTTNIDTKFTSSETVNATAADVDAALKRVARSATVAGQAMAASATTSSKAISETATKVTYFTKSLAGMDKKSEAYAKATKGAVLLADGNAVLKARVTATSHAMNQLGDTVKKGEKNWLSYTAGVFGGISLYQIASSALRTLRSALSDVGQAAFGLNAMLEENRAAFANFLGSVGKADTMLADLFKFAAVTPFEFPDLVEQTKRVMAFGFAADDVIPILTSVGNAAAGLGTGAVGIDRMTLALGQMAAKGKVQGQELRQLAEAGIRVVDIMRMVAEKYGVSLGEVMAMQEQGKVKAEDFIAAFKEYSTLKFGDMMGEQSKKFRGAMSTIKDITQMTIANAFKPFFDQLSKIAYATAQAMQTDKFKQQAKEFEQAVKGMTDALTKFAGIVSENIAPVAAIAGALALAGAVKVATAAITALVAFVAANPLVLVLGTGIFLVTKAIQDNTRAVAEAQKAEVERVTIAKKALGEEFDAYDKLFQKRAGLEEELAGWKGVVLEEQRTRGLRDAIADLTAEMSPYEAQLSKASTAQGSWILGLRMYTDAMILNRGAVSAAADSLGTYVLSSKQIQENTEALMEPMKNLRGELTKIVEKQILAGDTSLTFGENLIKALGIVRTPTEKFDFLVKGIADRFAALTPELQSKFAPAIASIFRMAREGALNTDAGIKELTDTIIALDTAFNTVGGNAKKRLEEIKQAAKDFVSGMLSVFGDFQDIIDKSVGTTYDTSKIDEAKIKIQKLGAELLQKEEQIRRAMGTSTVAALNWTQALKDGDAPLEEQKADAAKLRLEITQTTAEIQKMTAANEGASNRAVEGWKKVIASIGEYLAKVIYAQEAEGKITAAQAQQRLDAIDKIYGKEATASTRLQRDLEQSTAALMDFNIAGFIALADASKAGGDAAKRGDDQVKAFAARTKDWAEKIKEAAFQFHLLGPEGDAAFVKLQEAALKAQNPVKVLADGIANIPATMKRFADKHTAAFFEKLGESPEDIAKLTGAAAKEIEKPMEDAGKDAAKTFVGGFTQEMSDKGRNFEVIGENVTGGLAKGMTDEQSVGKLKNAAKYLADLVVATAEHHLDEESPSRVMAGIGQNVTIGLADGIEAAQPHLDATVISLIQDLLKLFSGLSVDPRLGEMSSVVGSVIDAFAKAMDAFKTLDQYVAPARSTVEAAVADFRDIVHRLVGIGLELQWVNWEIIGNSGSGASSALDAFSSGIEVLTALAEYVSPARSVIDAFVDDMHYIAQRLVTFADVVGGELVGTALQSLGDAVGAWIEPLTKLQEYVGLTRDKATGVAPQLAAFVNDIAGLIGRLRFLSDWMHGQTEDLPEQMIELGNVLAAVIEPLGGAIEVLAGIKDYEPLIRDASGTAPILTSFMADLQGLFGRMKGLSAWLAGQEGLADDMKTLGTTMDAVFDPLKTVGEVLESIKEYVPLLRNAEGISPILESFMVDLQGIMGRMKYLAEWLFRQADELPQQMKDLGAVIQSVFAPLAMVVEALSAIRKYIPLARDTAGIAPLLDSFQNDLFGLFGRMVHLANWLVNQGDDTTTRMGNLGAAMQAVFSPLKDVLEVLKGIREYIPLLRNAAGIAPLLDSFEQDLRGLFGRMRNLAGWLENEGAADDMKTLGEVMSSVFEGLGKALSVISETVKIYVDRGTADFAQAVTFVDNSLRQLIGLLQSLMNTSTTVVQVGEGMFITTEATGVVLSDALVTYSEMLGKVLAPLLSAISVTSAAIDLSKKLEDTTVSWSSIIGTLDSATRNLVGLMQSWANVTTTVVQVGEGMFITTTTGLALSEGLVAYAEMLGKVLTPFQTIISVTQAAIGLTDTLTDRTIDWATIINTLDAAANNLIATMFSWAQLGNSHWLPITAEMAKFAETLGHVLAPFQTIISVTRDSIALAEMLEKKTINWATVINILDAAANNLIATMFSWAQMGNSHWLPITKEMGVFAELLSKVLAPFQTIIGVTRDAIELSEFLVKRTVDWASIVNTLDDAARELVGALRAWANTATTVVQVGEGMYTTTTSGLVIDKALAAYADLLGRVLSPFSTIIGITTSAADLSERLVGHTVNWTMILGTLDDAARNLVNAVRSWATTTTIVTQVGEGMYITITSSGLVLDEALVAYADMLSKTLAPMQTVIALASNAIDLSEKMADKTLSWAAITGVLDTATRQLISVLKKWAGISEGVRLPSAPTPIGGGGMPITEALVAYAEMLSKVLSPMQVALSITSGAIDLAEKLANKTLNWDTVMSVLNTAVRQLVTTMKGWAGISDAVRRPGAPVEIGAGIPISEELVTYADTLGRVLAPMQTVLSILTSLIDFSEKLRIGVPKWATIMLAVQNGIEQVILAMGRMSTNTALLAALAGVTEDFVNKLTLVLSPISLAVDTLTKVSEYVALARRASAGIPAQITGLAKDLRDMAQQFAQKMANITLPEELGDKAKVIEAILGPIKIWLDVVEGIRTYVPLVRRQGEAIPQVIRSLARDLKSLVVRAIRIFVTVLSDDESWKDLGERMPIVSSVVQAFQGALDMFTKLASWKRPVGFTANVQAFVADVKIMIRDLSSLSLPTDVTWLDLEEMSNALAAAAVGFNEMFTMISNLGKGYTPLNTATLQIALANIATFLTEAMHTPNWHNLGWAAGGSLTEGIAAGLQRTSSWGIYTAALERIKATARAIKTTVSASLGTNDIGYDIGRSFIERLAAGIIDNLPILQSALNRVSGMLGGIGGAGGEAAMGGAGAGDSNNRSPVVNINFNGGINANSPGDIRKIVDAVNKILGGRGNLNDQLFAGNIW